jgi:hypothetical protein
MEKKKLDAAKELIDAIMQWAADYESVLCDKEGNPIEAYVISKDKNGKTKVLKAKKESNKE